MFSGGLVTAQRLRDSLCCRGSGSGFSLVFQQLLQPPAAEQSRGIQPGATRSFEVGAAVDLPSWPKGGRAARRRHHRTRQEGTAKLRSAPGVDWRGGESDDPTGLCLRRLGAEGPDELITGTVERPTGAGGDPAVKSQTDFGGAGRMFSSPEVISPVPRWRLTCPL